MPRSMNVRRRGAGQKRQHGVVVFFSGCSGVSSARSIPGSLIISKSLVLEFIASIARKLKAAFFRRAKLSEHVRTTSRINGDLEDFVVAAIFVRRDGEEAARGRRLQGAA